MDFRDHRQSNERGQHHLLLSGITYYYDIIINIINIININIIIIIITIRVDFGDHRQSNDKSGNKSANGFAHARTLYARTHIVRQRKERREEKRESREEREGGGEEMWRR